ncbi:MAG: transglycosylase SLT domain-containing protein, partial [Calditrichia bacterium]
MKWIIYKLLLPLGAAFMLLLICGYQWDTGFRMPLYSSANQAYQAGDYKTALESWFELLADDPQLLKKDPLLHFKIAYSFYRTGEYQKAIRNLNFASGRLEKLADYALWFQALSYYQLGDTVLSESKMLELEQRFPQSFLNDFSDSLRAGIAENRSQPQTARKLLLDMLASGWFEKTEIYVRLLNNLQALNKADEFKSYAFQFLAAYPFHPRADKVYQDLINLYSSEMPDVDLRRLLRYLYTTSQFQAAEQLIVNQSRYARTAADREMYRWLAVESDYKQGLYQKVLDWCLSNRGNMKTYRVRREIALHIARAYSRLDKTPEAIKAYLDFQRRYPTDGISQEVLWKVGWLYEEEGNVERANAIYQKLIREYPHAEFRNEAAFRIGINYFRSGRFEAARNTWQAALRQLRYPDERQRMLYWIGRSYGSQKMFDRQYAILEEIAEDPVESYYGMKALYLTVPRNGDQNKIMDAFWNVQQQDSSYIGRYISRFQRALLVKEVLSAVWVNRELQQVDISRKDWRGLFALAELYERIGAYGKAYRRYRNAYDTGFANASLTEMMPVYKRLYPLYFEAETDSAANRFGISQPLIFSVIKKESAFEPEIVSYANAYGLMQLIPPTAAQVAREMGIKYHSPRQLFDPQLNILMGTSYLSGLLNRFNGSLVMALAAYNAGP